jgi:hypothetical protein
MNTDLQGSESLTSSLLESTADEVVPIGPEPSETLLSSVFICGGVSWMLGSPISRAVDKAPAAEGPPYEQLTADC